MWANSRRCGIRSLAPTEADSIAYNLSSTPGAPATFSGVPNPQLADLNVGASFDAYELELTIPLFRYGRLLSLFDKGGLEIKEQDIVIRKGTIRILRNLTLMLALDIRLSVQVRVQVFFDINPFADFDSPDPFLGPFADSPSLAENAFGAVVVGFGVKADLSVSAAFFAGLIAPWDPLTPDLVFKPLAAVIFRVAFDATKRTVTLDARFTFTIKGAIRPRPLVFEDGLRLLGGGFRPDRLALGFVHITSPS